ncbi:MAG: hypothetical protein ACKPKO_55025, partial [Candidatus Fonsibacter sp.]
MIKQAFIHVAYLEKAYGDHKRCDKHVLYLKLYVITFTPVCVLLHDNTWSKPNSDLGNRNLVCFD